MKKFCFIDFETYSEADPGDVGSYEYSRHPSTEVVCASWKIGTRETIRSAKRRNYCPQLGIGDGEDLKKVLSDRSLYKVAFNSGFDRLIAHFVVGVPQTIEEWICAAALVATHALPRNLGGAADVLELSRRKNTEGKALIRKYSKPRKPTKKDPSTRCYEIEGLKRFLAYCGDDVDAMVEVFLTMPPLSKMEREVFKLNQRINFRGVATDQLLLKNAIQMIESETTRLDGEVECITKGELRSARQNKALSELLLRRGVMLPNLQRETVENAVASGLVSGQEKKLLEIRLAISKTSTSKYLSFQERTKVDGRVRDLQMYHGAATGREAGMGVQPHNLPKPTIDDPALAVETIREGDLAWVRAVCGEPMEALSSAIRGVLMATPGFEMFCADFNAIEARVVLWLAGDMAGLREFESGDPYKSEAVGIYKTPFNLITDDQRAVGKAIVLGCGFGMGAAKFFLTCKQKGMAVTKELAAIAVRAYRTKHHQVPALWKALESAAIQATLHPGRVVKTHRTKWFVKGKFLYCELPSGRRLAYYGPEVVQELTPWEELRPKLYRWYQDSQTRQWKRGATWGGELTENVVQAIARDIMVVGQLKTEAQGYKPLFSVHDECVGEKKKGRGSVEEFEKLMAELPEWAAGLIVRVKGFKCDRYRKG